MTQQELKEILQKIKSDDNITDLICSKWGYIFQEQEIPEETFDEKVREKIKHAKIIASDKEDIVKVILLRVNFNIESKINKITISSLIRKTHKSLPEKYKQSLFIVAADDFKTLQFSQVRTFDNSIRIRKFIIELPTIYRTPLEQLVKLDLNTNQEKSSSDKLEECFDIDSVSQQFFDDYKKIFDKIVDDIDSQIKNKNHAHDFTQQFFNRVMFLYFLQKKGWLDNDKSFIKNYWQNYLENKENKNNFYNDYLQPLFFLSLKREMGKPVLPSEAPNLPESLRSKLQMFPYLNGTLFTDNDLDELTINFKDELIKESIEQFLELYNFTIDEESPVDIELSIDPLMLGLVYESLVNSKDRGKDGIFYTDKVELDMMCRLSLTRYLFKNSSISKEKIYQWIFKEEGEKEADIIFNGEELNKLYSLLEKIKIVDPACGSGGYLVMFLNILFSLMADLTKRRNLQPESYNLKKQIIEHSLYGVDVNNWAINIARLRLWLNLIIEADDSLKESHMPLLPSLDFKIRQGDSLVQEIAGIPIVVGNTKGAIADSQIKRKITELINRKTAFYYNRPYLEQKQTRDLLFLHESNIFRDILVTQRNYLTHSVGEQNQLFEMAGKPHQPNLLKNANNEKISEINSILENLNKFTKEKAFWPISFAEVFSEENNGFDIVIANPPYVRQEKIGPPEKEKPDDKEKKEYKAELNKSTRYWFDWFEKNKLSGRSDLYVFFYLLGLKLLNQNGVFCYISENSWLDVGYGKELQEFLLSNVPMAMIIDNQVKRSFKSANVNTIVAIFDAPNDKEKHWDNLVKFINFKKEFEAINNSNTFLEIESENELSNNKPKSTDKYRIFNITQQQLYDNGLVKQKTESGLEIEGGKYEGDKWGGKYLRAPDIYWKILEKGKDKLVRLGHIADVRFGIKTGANEFFYLEDITDEVEEG